MSTWFAEYARRLVPLLGEEITIGRSRTCALALADPSVSRVHAVISRVGGRLEIQDLGSTNGTYRNGVRLSDPCPLVEGDCLEVGETEIWIRVDVGTADGEGERARADEVVRPEGLDFDAGSTSEMDPASRAESSRGEK